MSDFILGNITFHDPVILAPMAGVTDQSFRAICRRYGADFCVSEMISAKGMYYHDEKTGMLAGADADSSPYAIQIFGSEPDIMALAAKRLCKLDYKGCKAKVRPVAIDINMGCPVHKIVSNGDGSALMKKITLAGQIISSVSKAIDIPVTVKMRTGWDDSSINAVKFAVNAEENGAKMLVVHGRTKEGMYFAPVDYETIAAVKRAVSIPVIGNGGIFSGDDAVKMFELTGCDGIAVGRGAEGNPFIFAEIKAKLEGIQYTRPDERERTEALIKHIEMLVADKGEFIGVRESRKHIAWYMKGIRNSSVIRADANYVSTMEDVYTLLKI